MKFTNLIPTKIKYMTTCQIRFFFKPTVFVDAHCVVDKVYHKNSILLKHLRTAVDTRIAVNPQMINYRPEAAKIDRESYCTIYSVEIDEKTPQFLLRGSLKLVDIAGVNRKSFVWHRSVIFFKYGAGIKSGVARKNSVLELIYVSSMNFDEFLAAATQAFPNCTFWEGEGNVLTEENFFATIENNFNVFVLPNSSCYSDITMAMILQRVNICIPPPSEEDMRNVIIVNQLDGRKYAILDYLEKFEICLMLHENGMTERVQSFKNYLSQNHTQLARWNKLTALCTSALNQLNKTYLPSQTFSQAARRMIINPIVMMLSDFFQTNWTVEKNIEKNPNCIGWGNLDYTIEEKVQKVSPVGSGESKIFAAGVPFDPVIVCEAPDIQLEEPAEEMMAEEEEEEEEEEDIVENEGNSPSSSSSQPSSSKRRKLSHPSPLDIEAKDRLVDKHLAQLCAQMLDMWIGKTSSGQPSSGSITTVRGILTNGRRWKFFSLRSKLNNNEGPYPVTLAYEGEKVLHILRYTSNVTFNQRLSGLLNHELEIKANELEEVLYSLAATYFI